MRILVLGVDGASPELLLADERLENIRQLMQIGCYGPLQGISPPDSILSWLSLVTGQDPGSMGLYGPTVRLSHSYFDTIPLDWQSTEVASIWNQLGDDACSILVGVPPSYPPRTRVSASIANDPLVRSATAARTHPMELEQQIVHLVGRYPFSAATDPMASPVMSSVDIFQDCRARFRVARDLLERFPWDYFQMVDFGLPQIRRAYVAEHATCDGNVLSPELADDFALQYCRCIDEELGGLLQLLDDDVAILIVSTNSTRRLAGTFFVNQWLIREGLLVLDSMPYLPTPLTEATVDWSRTKVWAEGGSVARFYINQLGRQPHGFVEAGDHQATCQELADRLAGVTCPEGQPIPVQADRPERIYQRVVGNPPDLIATLDEHSWNCDATVGHAAGKIAVSPVSRDGPCPVGAFIMVASDPRLQGSLEGVHLFDIAPTMLDLVGCEIPKSLSRPSLLGVRDENTDTDDVSAADRDLITERLRGLGYIE